MEGLTHTQRQTETDRDRQRQRETERDRERQTDHRTGRFCGPDEDLENARKSENV